MENTTQTIMKWQETAINFLVAYGFQLVGATIILIVGLLVARWVGKGTDNWLVKHQLEPPIRLLIVRVVRLLVMAFALVLVAGQLGVQLAPLVAGIGVIGVGIGLAMQGMLSNVIAGLTLIFTKPFRVGEYIELLGVYGQVTNIELFSTKLVHADRSIVTIPNRKIIGEIMHNYGTIRQLDLSVGVAYDSDISKVLQTVREVLSSNPRVLKTPAAVIGIESLGASSIDITLRPWVSVPDFAVAQLELYQSVVEKFRAANISIPFPQQEVRMVKEG